LAQIEKCRCNSKFRARRQMGWVRAEKKLTMDKRIWRLDRHCFFLGKNWRECRGCFGNYFSDGTGYQAATLHAAMQIDAAFKTSVRWGSLLVPALHGRTP
jgi:hypothetical protein